MPFEQGLISREAAPRILVFRPWVDLDLVDLEPEQLYAITDNKTVHDELSSRGFLMDPGPDVQVDLAMVAMGRFRDQSHADIAHALSHLAPGGILLVDGPKTHGIDSLVRRLRQMMDVAGVLSKSHGKVVWLERPETIPQSIAAWQTLTKLQLNRDGFFAAPGMFSHERIDPGTGFLSQTIGDPLVGRVADLGAGWGALSQISMAQHSGIEALDLFELDRAALEAAKRNIDDPRVAFHWADATRIVDRDRTYDFVVTNPPFHESRTADPGLGAEFIRTAARILKPKGILWLVANRHLPYEAELNIAFGQWTEVAVTPQYKVIRATQPKTKT